MNQRLATVLIVDNDDGVVAAIRTRLQPFGYRCETARTGAQGLAAFDDAVIDLVITDLSMPILDGVGMIQRIRAISNVPIIVITGFQTEFNHALKYIGGVNVLPKPFRADDLVSLVEAEVFVRQMHQSRSADGPDLRCDAA
jgi:DNA-binding response OmpR family regulator